MVDLEATALWIFNTVSLSFCRLQLNFMLSVLCVFLPGAEDLLYIIIVVVVVEGVEMLKRSFCPEK